MNIAEQITSELDLVSVSRLTTDLAKASKNLSNGEARFLVNHYYKMQDNRIRYDAQSRELKKTDEPREIIDWFGGQAELMENQIKRALDRYSSNHLIGEWLRDIDGIGPVIAAGILAHLDIHRATTVGAFWRFAGMDPTSVWNEGNRRPWNAQLKVLCWKAGQSFIMRSTNEKNYYGYVIFRERRAKEWEKNLSGELMEQAIAKKNSVGKSTDGWKWYNGCYKPEDIRRLRKLGSLSIEVLKTVCGEPGSGLPMLPPAHIEARATRFTIKVFLFDLFDYWYRKAGRGEPPVPYFIAILKHAHILRPPGYQA